MNLNTDDRSGDGESSTDNDGIVDDGTGATSIVIVDDDRLLLSLVVDGLESQGLPAVGCYSTAEAEARLRTAPCKLLISDQAMARHDEGLDLLRTALDNGWCRRALLISGYPRERRVDERVRPEIHFLQKPFRLPALVALCRELLAD